MIESKYLDSFTDLKARIEGLLSEIARKKEKEENNENNKDIKLSYLAFLDNFLVLVDQIIKDFHEGKIENERLALLMSEKQNKIMSTLNTIIYYQQNEDWEGVAYTIVNELETELLEWEESVKMFFSNNTI